MKIYKIILVIQERKRGGRIIDVERKEAVVVDNLETARFIYDEYKNTAECSFQYARYFGVVALFEPGINKNGTLAHWCDEPIEMYRKDG